MKLASLGLMLGLWWRRLGFMPWLIALALALTAALHLQLSPRVRTQTALLEADVARQTRVSHTAPTQTDSAPVTHPTTERLAAFRAILPPQSALPEQLASVFKAAETARITLAQGDYRLEKNPLGGYVALKVALPVKSGYPALRQFVQAVLADHPNVALDDISFKRDVVGAATGDARLRLSLFYRDGDIVTKAP